MTPDKENIIITVANKNDVNEIFSIEKECLNLWKKEYFINEFENDFSIVLKVEHNLNLTGFAVIWILSEEIQVQNISIKKNYQNQGIGSFLFNYIIQKYAQKNKKDLILEVNSNNKHAIDFYKKCGFSCASTTQSMWIYDGDDH